MSNVKTLNSTNKSVPFFLLSLLAVAAITIFPDMAHATDADQSISDGVAFFVKMLKYGIYGLMGLTFVVMMWLLVKSLLDWKDENKREGTVGGIVAVVFIGLMVMGIIFLLGEKAIDYFDTNLVVSQIQPVINIMTTLA